MKYDIYAGYGNEEPGATMPVFEYEGMNPADALARFAADQDAMREARSMGDLTGLEASDDEMVASLHPMCDGSFELHVHVDGTDTAITVPPTEFMSITEAADALDLTRQRVHVLLQGGQLHGVKVGNAWVVYRASVMDRLAHM